MFMGLQLMCTYVCQASSEASKWLPVEFGVASSLKLDMVEIWEIL